MITGELGWSHIQPNPSLSLLHIITLLMILTSQRNKHIQRFEYNQLQAVSLFCDTSSFNTCDIVSAFLEYKKIGLCYIFFSFNRNIKLYLMLVFYAYCLFCNVTYGIDFRGIEDLVEFFYFLNFLIIF